jgi:hypothetical protein
MMLGSIVRFWLNGWIYDLYIKPEFHFTYYGFEWVKALGGPGMYTIFAVMGISALFILLGLFYRFSAFIFFVSFTYVELIDKSNYLNHYYFISIVAFIMILLPAGRFFSMDSYLNPSKRITHIPRWFITIIQLQLGLVYFFAGVAKLNPDWLFEAQPLKIWLQAHTDLPLIGPLMDKAWIAFFFSWFGAVYDLTIPFFLSFSRTRGLAYFFVIAFHILTRILFQIGMFPYIMILATLIFFSEGFHLKVISALKKMFLFVRHPAYEARKEYVFRSYVKPLFISFVTIHFLIQLVLPFRYVLYPGKLFWTEQGFRFSWRVMLMEKAGKVFFHVRDKKTGRSGETMMNNDLTANQEKMMATQPDMILQYAHFLKERYKKEGMDVEIYAECYVTMNGSGSRLFIDRTTDLAAEEDSFGNKKWILPFEEGLLHNDRN